MNVGQPGPSSLTGSVCETAGARTGRVGGRGRVRERIAPRVRVLFCAHDVMLSILAGEVPVRARRPAGANGGPCDM